MDKYGRQKSMDGYGRQQNTPRKKRPNLREPGGCHVNNPSCTGIYYQGLQAICTQGPGPNNSSCVHQPSLQDDTPFEACWQHSVIFNSIGFGAICNFNHSNPIPNHYGHFAVGRWECTNCPDPGQINEHYYEQIQTQQLINQCQSASYNYNVDYSNCQQDQNFWSSGDCDCRCKCMTGQYNSNVGDCEQNHPHFLDEIVDVIIGPGCNNPSNENLCFNMCKNYCKPLCESHDWHDMIYPESEDKDRNMRRGGRINRRMRRGGRTRRRR